MNPETSMLSIFDEVGIHFFQLSFKEDADAFDKRLDAAVTKLQQSKHFRLQKIRDLVLELEEGALKKLNYNEQAAKQEISELVGIQSQLESEIIAVEENKVKITQDIHAMDLMICELKNTVSSAKCSLKERSDLFSKLYKAHEAAAKWYHHYLGFYIQLVSSESVMVMFGQDINDVCPTVQLEVQSNKCNVIKVCPPVTSNSNLPQVNYTWQVPKFLCTLRNLLTEMNLL